ncbi:MAG: lysine--tRNA ligase [Anaerolineales bacterium]|jgi:lysyl-tRNA synthetase class 2
MADWNKLEQIRLEKMQALVSQGINPFPSSVTRTHTTAEAINAFEEAGESDTVQATVVGRIRSIREMGKVIFTHIEDGNGKLQLFFRQNDLGDEAMQRFADHFDLGDFIEASGKMFRTRSGEVTLHVEQFRMISKAIRQLPAAKEEEVDGERVVHSAFSDPEARYRERYADLAVNPDVRRVFETRAHLMQALRAFFDQRGFLEVETPVLQPIYGGAAASPFVTHHNQLHQDLYLRVSFELYLKRLIVGGFEAVYEIGRDFRNEGVSFKHNPEFTMLEYYQAYVDYTDVMDTTEELIEFVAKELTGSTSITYQGQTIDLSPPWKRIPLREALIDSSGIDIDEHKDASTLREAMRTQDLETKPDASRGKLIDSLLGSTLEPNLIQPTIVYDYPRDISPLAKSKPDDPDTVERFEAFIGGMEICNAFSEINSPLEQEERFREMGREYDVDDEERHPMDEDYLRALSYGMPPTGGFGMGIDRLTMLFTNQTTIREVILFPHLRSRDRKESEQDDTS